MKHAGTGKETHKRSEEAKSNCPWLAQDIKTGKRLPTKCCADNWCYPMCMLVCGPAVDEHYHE